MIAKPTFGFQIRMFKQLSAGLHLPKPRLRSAPVRKETARCHPRWSQWSELDAAQEFASAFDRALWMRKDARMQGYHVRLPGQTGMRSLCAISSPEAAGGRGDWQ
jgi:hypothetical protein